MTDISYLPGPGGGSGPDSYDECLAPDGAVRPGWEALVDSLGELTGGDLKRLESDVSRLLEDDGVTYTPTRSPLLVWPGELGGAEEQPLMDPLPWELDPVPLVVDGREWHQLELGLAQRAELLNRILVDLYGEQRLLSEGMVPAIAIFGHEEYLRPMVGTDLAPSAHQLFMTGTDLGRAADGEWQVLSDRTQAPSGAGYAMQNRRVVSRVLPELYHEANLFRLTPFFHTMRMGLVDAAPSQVEDPRVVVLSPGAHSETAFDQAFLASLLGFPLVEGSDLIVREGRVWLQSVGRNEPVDVILRRVDAGWTDPLELRQGSRLGVSGLTDCVRRGTVSVVNSLGSGVLENPALLPYLPDLCTELLGEELRIASVPTLWCGREQSRREVLDNLDSLVIRSINRTDGRSIVGAMLPPEQRAELVAQIEAQPHRFVGQELLPLSTAPALVDGVTPQERIAPREVVLRSFTIRQAQSYVPMFGGLAQVMPAERDETTVVPDQRTTKDVWVVSQTGAPDTTVHLSEGTMAHPGLKPGEAMVPRVLDDLFWFGRYAERAEQLLRLVLAVRGVAVEQDFRVRPGGDLDILLRAVTHLSASYPGFVNDTPDPTAELRAMLLDSHRRGTVARSLGALSYAAQGVRDQLSADVWMVLAGIDRALTGLRAARLDRGNQLADSGERVLSSLLALSGITAENMVRDSGWYLLDAGRGVERALQISSLLRHTLVPHGTPEAEEHVIEATLEAAESIVTFRRRYAGAARQADVLELLVLDASNPRSVAFQIRRITQALHAVPGSATSRPLRLADELAERLAEEGTGELFGHATTAATRSALDDWLHGIHDQLEQLAEAISEQYLKPPPAPRSISFDSVGGD
ncbi:circularly permuted type 2 ATP-grasp protein [Propionibacteriaceae bacterium Y1700]|uniref:circularly permuted type 2 ATP-grasp protein n=1 Tax=Microlunatus sp. Y1700 TaxID=3418487 RepID=UPI003DA6D064